MELIIRKESCTLKKKRKNDDLISECQLKKQRTEVFYKKLFLKFSEYPLENICDEVSFLIKLQPAIYYEEIPTQGFSCEYCDMFKKNYYEEHLRTAASAVRRKLNNHFFCLLPSRFTVFVAYNFFCYYCQELSRGVLQKRCS